MTTVIITDTPVTRAGMPAPAPGPTSSTWEPPPPSTASPTRNNENISETRACLPPASRDLLGPALRLAPYGQPPAPAPLPGSPKPGCGPGNPPRSRGVCLRRKELHDGEKWGGGDAPLPPAEPEAEGGWGHPSSQRHLFTQDKQRPAEPGDGRGAEGAGTHLLGDGGVRRRGGRGARAGLGLHVPVEQSLALLRAAVAAQRRHLITESRGPSDRCWAGRGQGGGGRGQAEAEGGGRRAGTAEAAPAAGRGAPGPPQEPARGPRRGRAWGVWGKDARRGAGEGGGDH